ncbi:MAG: hypothetical protein ACPGID_11200, partial [Rubricella sp.]
YLDDAAWEAKVDGRRVLQFHPLAQASGPGVIDAGGREMIITQEYLEGDRIAQPGSTCRIQTNTRTGQSRVLPADQLPGTVAAPERTRVAY